MFKFSPNNSQSRFQNIVLKIKYGIMSSEIFCEKTFKYRHRQSKILNLKINRLRDMNPYEMKLHLFIIVMATDEHVIDIIISKIANINANKLTVYIRSRCTGRVTFQGVFFINSFNSRHPKCLAENQFQFPLMYYRL